MADSSHYQHPNVSSCDNRLIALSLTNCEAVSMRFTTDLLRPSDRPIDGRTSLRLGPADDGLRSVPSGALRRLTI